MKNNLFAIGIPTLNRADLLNEALASYVQDYPGTPIVIVDNGGQDIMQHSHIVTIRSPSNLGVAGSWNEMSEMVLNKWGIPNIWILNDDVNAGIHMDRIMRLCSEHFDIMVSEHHWASFILPRRTFQDVGPFDAEFWPAYYEDNDYAWRMVLKKKMIMVTGELNPLVFRNSMTVEKDPSLRTHITRCAARYKAKWGGEPGEERYRIAWDGRPPVKGMVNEKTLQP